MFPNRMRSCGLALAALVFSGCTTIPPEAVVSHRLLAKNIEVARQNQLLLIDQYAEDQKENKRVYYREIALPDALNDKASKDGTLPATDVAQMVTEYTNDLQSDLDSIEAKARKLREETNKGFDALSQLVSINEGYIETLKVRSDLVSTLLGKYRQRLDGLNQEFIDALAPNDSKPSDSPPKTTEATATLSHQ